jgi:hypothetical protein
MTESPKAISIPRRHKVSCDICMLLDNEAKDMKFHLYEEGFVTDEDKYVCAGCVEGMKDIRKKCHHKVDNPNHKAFENWIPWFAKEVPGLVDAFKKQLA